MAKVVRALQMGTLIGCLFVCGCGGKPYTYESNSDLKTGPGLFSGEAGKITIFKQRKEQEPEKSEEPEKKE